jgi:predicted RNase H-like HicB family nuclease
MTAPAYSFRVLWSDEDLAFVATCPEFEGVSGLGDSAEQALAEVQGALQLMIETYEQEGWELPAPASLPAYSGQFRLRVPRTLHARLAEAAADDGVSLNTFAVRLLSQGVGGLHARTTAERHAEMERAGLLHPVEGEPGHERFPLSVRRAGALTRFLEDRGGTSR